MKQPLRYILTVTELTQEIKDILEVEFPDIWVEGELSNLRIPSSGHLYFTLKDDFSQIRAVLFKGQARFLRFVPEDGLHVICRGRVSLYEKRGEYQIILETLEPKGIGALQLAFLQLKERLEKEGLFDEAHKKPLPMIPQRIGIITSSTGAVIQDMIRIIQRRFENVQILLYPVRVQGEGASEEIARGLSYLNDQANIDVIIVGRGGGSLEDLWPFNEEVIARAIYDSKIPVISAVGHETDYTISDFVADLRAATPSAAAELVVRDKREIKRSIRHLAIRLANQTSKIISSNRTHLAHMRRIIGDPNKRIQDQFLKLDDLDNRLRILIAWILKRNREKWQYEREALTLQDPIKRVEALRSSILETAKHLRTNFRHALEIHKEKVRGILGKLNSLSPLAILERGYSITRILPTLEILRDVSRVQQGDKVEVKLHRGALVCGVEKTKPS